MTAAGSRSCQSWLANQVANLWFLHFFFCHPWGHHLNLQLLGLCLSCLWSLTRYQSNATFRSVNGFKLLISFHAWIHVKQESSFWETESSVDTTTLEPYGVLWGNNLNIRISSLSPSIGNILFQHLELEIQICTIWFSCSVAKKKKTSNQQQDTEAINWEY